MSCNAKPACINRREFLVRAVLVAGSTVLTITFADAASGRALEEVTVPVTSDSPLAKVGGSIIVESSAGKIIVIHAAEKKFAAFSAVCTHKRGALAYDGKELACPKHGSRFDAASGNVTNGPAETALKSYPAKSGDGSVVIAVS